MPNALLRLLVPSCDHRTTDLWFVPVCVCVLFSDMYPYSTEADRVVIQIIQLVLGLGWAAVLWTNGRAFEKQYIHLYLLSRKKDAAIANQSLQIRSTPC